MPQIIHGMQAARRDLDTLLAGCDEAALERAMQHERLGRMTVRDIAVKMTAHEDEHAADVARLARQAPRFGACNHPPDADVHRDRLSEMSVVDEIKQRIDIVDLVSQYVTLKRAGRDYMALCPFHAERTPSFHVEPGAPELALLRRVRHGRRHLRVHHEEGRTATSARRCACSPSARASRWSRAATRRRTRAAPACSR